MQNKKRLPIVVTAAMILCLFLLTLLTLRQERNMDTTAQREPDRERLNSNADTLEQAEGLLPAETQKQTLSDLGEGEEDLPTQAASDATSGKRSPVEGGAASPTDALTDSVQTSQPSAAASGQSTPETTGNNVGANNDGAFDLPPDDF